MTEDTAALQEAREAVSAALQNYLNLSYPGPNLLLSWCTDLECVNSGGEKNLLLVASSGSTSWGILGMKMGGFRIASELLA